MLKEPTKQSRKPGGWSEMRRQLATWDKPALLDLVKDLYEVHADNRDFIQARCQVGKAGGEALEKYRRQDCRAVLSKARRGKTQTQGSPQGHKRFTQGHRQRPRYG